MNLVEIKNDQPVTTSLQVAEVFGKNHKEVTRDIRNLIGDIKKAQISNFKENVDNLESPNLDSVGKSAFLESANLRSVDISMFYEDSYRVEGNTRKYPMFYMNQDGWTLLVMGYQGEKATRFKLQYIAEFKRMKDELSKPKLSLPQNYASALRQLADTVEENERLKSQLNQQDFEQGILEQVKPLDVEVLYTTEEIALSLGYSSARALNQVMNAARFVYFQKNLWHLYAPYAKRGFKNYATRRNSQLWTIAGKQYIEKRFGLNKEEK